jgi:hypothetical protein
MALVKGTDPGYFGTPTKGVYVSRYLDYCLKYSNRGEVLDPKDQVCSSPSLPCTSDHIH